MTPDETRYQLADLRHCVARAKLLLQLASADHDSPACLADLLTFAKDIGDGDECAADSVTAFRAAQEEIVRTAQAELDRLAGLDAGR